MCEVLIRQRVQVYELVANLQAANAANVALQLWNGSVDAEQVIGIIATDIELEVFRGRCWGSMWGKDLLLWILPRFLGIVLEQRVAKIYRHILLIHMHVRGMFLADNGHLNAGPCAELLVGNGQIHNLIAVVEQEDHLVGVGDVQLDKVIVVVVCVEDE